MVHTLLIEWPDHNDLVPRLKACVEDHFEVKILGPWRANQRMQFQAAAAAREGCARDDITNVDTVQDLCIFEKLLILDRLTLEIDTKSLEKSI